MNALSLRPSGDTQRYIQSLVLSLLIHGFAVGAGLSFLGDLHLSPQPEPFKWEVSVVEAPAPEHEGPGLAPTPLTSSPTKTQGVDSQRATQPIQTVQPTQPIVHREVRHEIREVKPALQETMQAAQMVSRTNQSLDVAQQTAPSENGAIQETPPQAMATQAEVIPPTEAAQPVPQQVTASAVPTLPSDQSENSRQALEAPQSQPIERAKPEITEGTMKAAAAPVIQEAAVREHLGRTSPAAKPDYGWLAQALWSRIEQLKRYPHVARMNRWEGKVVLRAVIKEDGQVMNLEVAESSGHSVLDLDALEIMRQASPLKLKHALGQPQVVVQVPISYRLER